MNKSIYARAIALLGGTALAASALGGQYVLVKPTKADPTNNPTGGLLTTTPSNPAVKPGSSSYYPYTYSPVTGNPISGYGGTTGKVAGTAGCGKAITTTYVWKPNQIASPTNPSQLIDDPLDVAPATVVVQQTCCIIASAFTTNFAGTPSASCSDGLGSSQKGIAGPVYVPNPLGGYIQVGVGATATLTTTQYEQRAGGDTITLPCSPTATASAADGGANVDVVYNSSIINPQILIAGTTRLTTVTSDVIGVITGQQLQASLSVGDPTGALTVDPTSYSWSISGAGPFQDYITTSTLGQKVALAASQLTKPSVYYYTNETDNNIVSCTVTLVLPPGAVAAKGLNPFKLPKKTISSFLPTGTFQVTTGEIRMSSDQSSFGLVNSADGKVANGQVWSNAQITVPGGFPQTGQGCFIQLITASRKCERAVTNTNSASSYVDYNSNGNSMYGVLGLDCAVPYPFGTPVSWMLPLPGGGLDSPQQLTYLNVSDGGGNNWNASSATDEMTTWLMYRPPQVSIPGLTLKTVLIPMSSYKWGWEASAKLSTSNGSSTWVLTLGRQPTTTTPALTTVPPTWTNLLPYHFPYGPGAN